MLSKITVFFKKKIPRDWLLRRLALACLWLILIIPLREDFIAFYCTHARWNWFLSVNLIPSIQINWIALLNFFSCLLPAADACVICRSRYIYLAKSPGAHNKQCQHLIYSDLPPLLCFALCVSSITRYEQTLKALKWGQPLFAAAANLREARICQTRSPMEQRWISLPCCTRAPSISRLRPSQIADENSRQSPVCSIYTISICSLVYGSRILWREISFRYGWRLYGLKMGFKTRTISALKVGLILISGANCMTC